MAMLSTLQEQLKEVVVQSLRESHKSLKEFPPVILEIPNDKKHGEFSCNIALQLAKPLKQPPLDLAAQLVTSIQKNIKASPINANVQKIDVVRPGFINFHLSPQALYGTLSDVLAQGENYGRASFGKNKKIQVEFVSANPTGPLSVAHARQAAVGDALVNILNFTGFAAKKEFYVNDEGNQINILGRSVELRAQELLGEKVEFSEDCYQGDYIRDMARIYLDQNKIKKAADLSAKADHIRQFAVDYLLDVIKKELDDFGVHFDVWSHQSKIGTQGNIEAVLDFLGEKGFLYEKEGALWFKSTDFGDDKDRVVEKSDGNYTYLTPDIVYHQNKFKRGFEKIINIWGPDHHGYIPRIKAVVEALGYDRDDVEVLIVQLATLYRNGQPISMSTRRGQYISLREVMTEVGVDAARFFFLMRRISAHLDFDLELAKKETPENPVYYIQYAHARIYSVWDKAKELNLRAKHADFSLLNNEEELDLLKKIGQFSGALVLCAEQLDPYALVNYLHELATIFHRFYDKHRVIDQDHALAAERLALLDASRIVFANGLRLLGVSTPKKM
ncbi:MAG: arginine--tRNA ligase [Omnitrophica WOR_2 bacterium RIFCSPHIGHO2_01_FULL_48_9]|nr:MAG: arginine--tRNA ligase [Omnitrophica WOR_2 bacterium RIFCSPHIGHO2_01_FULL_48_9]